MDRDQETGSGAFGKKNRDGLEGQVEEPSSARLPTQPKPKESGNPPRLVTESAKTRSRVWRGAARGAENERRADASGGDGVDGTRRLCICTPNFVSTRIFNRTSS